MKTEVDQILADRMESRQWLDLNKINLTDFFYKTNMPYLVFECRLQVFILLN